MDDCLWNNRRNGFGNALPVGQVRSVMVGTLGSGRSAKAMYLNSRDQSLARYLPAQKPTRAGEQDALPGQRQRCCLVKQGALAPHAANDSSSVVAAAM